MKAKPARLLTEGRVHIPDVDRVIVDGDTDQYVVTWRDTEWECSCLGWMYRRTCSHAEAVRAVTQPPKAA